MTESRYNIPNLQRGIRVIEYLAQHHIATANELVAATGIPKNSVYRICMTLRGMGYITRAEEEGTFRLSSKLMALCLLTLADARLEEVARSEMIALRDQTKETVVLFVRMNLEMVAIDQVSGVHPFRMMVDPGFKTPFHCSGQGKAYAAFLPDAERNELTKSINYTRFTKETLTGPITFSKELKKTRERGYACDNGETAQGIRCVSAPIFNHKGLVVAALTVTGPEFRLGENMRILGEQTQSCAARISKRMGCIAIG